MIVRVIMEDESGSARSSCKIDRVADAYGQEDIDAEILRRRETNDASLRELARFVNVRLMEAVLESADADVAGDPTSVYEALTGAEVSPKRQASVRNRLTDAGIDVDELADDFVSYQVVRTHLRECLGEDTGRDGIETIQEGRELIASSLDRERQIIERTIERLQRVSVVDPGDISVSLSARIRCEKCGTSYTMDEYLDGDGCHCSQ